MNDAFCPLALMRGDLAAAEGAIATLIDRATRTNTPLWKMIAASWQGKLFIDRGECARGIEPISQTLEACEQSDWQVCYAQFTGYLVDGLVGLGHLDEAAARLERAIA